MAARTHRKRKVQRSLKTLLQVPLEKKEAVWFLEWAYSQPLIKDLIIHIPNEGKRPDYVGYQLKRQGLRPGVSDFFIPLPRPEKGLHGLWIELKRSKGGRLSKDQEIWLERMIAMGYAGYVAHGWVHAAAIVRSYMS